MRKSLKNLAAALAFGLTVASPIAALAHAVVVKAQPALDQQIAAGPLAVRLELNSRIDKERSKLELTTPDGAKTEVPLDQAGDPNVLTATMSVLTAGAYNLRWQVLSVDGHITRGDIPFSVGP